MTILQTLSLSPQDLQALVHSVIQKVPQYDGIKPENIDVVDIDVSVNTGNLNITYAVNLPSEADAPKQA